MLVVEKYTSFEYSQKNGNLSNLSSQRLSELQESHEMHQRTKDSALGLLDKNGIEYVVVKNDEVKNVNYAEFDSVMSLGGDGTALHAMFYITGQSFFGVNTDNKKSVGKLTKLNVDSLEDALIRFLSGDDNIEYWDRLSAKVNERKIPYLSVNEILLADPRIYKTTHLQMESEGKTSHSVSNGAIISTSQGSSAFYKSSGGTAFDVRAIGYNVIMPYSLNGNLEKTGLVSIDEKIIVKPKREHYKLIFDCNEQRSVDLQHGDIVEIGIDEKDRLKVVV